MASRRTPDLKVEFENYKSEIYTMLIALGCTQEQAIAYIADNEETIRSWLDPKRGRIINAQMGARLLLRKA